MGEDSANRGLIARATNWDRNPAGVWYIAGPLTVIGFSLEFLHAVLVWIQTGSPVLFFMCWGFFALLVVSLIPGMKMLARTRDHGSQN
jgi:hypothetical protein